MGDSVTLSASGVDDDVFYIWKFADGEIIIAETETARFRLRGSSDRKHSYLFQTEMENVILHRSGFSVK